MINDRIDLYEYFGIARGGATGGFLTSYIPQSTPELSDKLRPAMLVIAGGGYAFVSDREKEPVALKYMMNGFASFVLEYTVHKMYPTPFVEACMAVAYIRLNADKYGVDKAHVCAVGFSAGGHIAGVLATMTDEKELKSALGKNISLAKPNAVILSYAVTELPIRTKGDANAVISGGDQDLLLRISPARRVTKDSVPAFIWHTYEDDTVPVENSLLMATAYRKAGVPFALHIFEHGPHGLSLCSEETHNLTDADYAAAPIGKWFELSVDWLKRRGFVMTVKDKKTK